MLAFLMTSSLFSRSLFKTPSFSVSESFLRKVHASQLAWTFN